MSFSSIRRINRTRSVPAHSLTTKVNRPEPRTTPTPLQTPKRHRTSSLTKGISQRTLSRNRPSIPSQINIPIQEGTVDPSGIIPRHKLQDMVVDLPNSTNLSRPRVPGLINHRDPIGGPKRGDSTRLSNLCRPAITPKPSCNSKVWLHPARMVHPTATSSRSSQRTSQHKIPTSASQTGQVSLAGHTRHNPRSACPGILQVEPEAIHNPFEQTRNLSRLNVKISSQNAWLSPSNNRQLA